MLGLCLLGALGTALILAPAALASQSFTWTGESTFSEEWSFGEDWQGHTAPEASGQVGALTFPPLTSTACTGEEEEEKHPCYISINNETGLGAESMTVDGNGYFIGGEELTLGQDGLTIAPDTGSARPYFEFLDLPFHLGATQTWRLSNRSGGKFSEARLSLEGAVTGPAGHELTIELANQIEPLMRGSVEVGPLTIAGANPDEAGVFNGAFPLLGTDLNSVDEQPVSLRHIFFLGSGSVGPLRTEDANVSVGSSHVPAGDIEAPSVSLDPASIVDFQITANGTTPKTDYAQLVSRGAIELNGAAIGVLVRPPEKDQPCPVLTPGEVFTFVSTTAALTGSLRNALESGPELPITFAEGCPQLSQTIRIGYQESGATETVTGTVEQAKKDQEEEDAAIKRGQQEALDKVIQEHARQVAEEAAAVKKREEEAAKAGVLSIKERSPSATIASASLTVDSSGAFVVKIRCPAGASSCAGTITLRTLRAVSATAVGHNAGRTKRILTLAVGPFKVAGGRTKAVTLHLSSSGRTLLAHSHVLSARATIVAHNPAGAVHTAQTIVTLRASKSKHGKA